MRVKKVAIIAEKKFTKSAMYYIPHESPKNECYCLNIYSYLTSGGRTLLQ